MVSETLARRYATAVFALASDGNDVARVGTDLAAIEAAIDGEPAVRSFFLSPVVDRTEKERAFRTVFEGRVGDVALHTLLLLVRKRREPILGALLAQYRRLQQAASGAEPLTVASAQRLGEADLAGVVARLERHYGKRFNATQVVNPGLIGGLRITMGDRLVDGTVAGQLEALSRTLFAPN